jgi:hypothetical protein
MKFTKIPATLIKIATSIAGIIGFIGAIVGIMSYLHDAGGTLSVTMNGKSVENNSTKECVIFMDSIQKTSTFSPQYPTISNSSSYSIKDFNLKYHIKCRGLVFTPTDYYTLHDDGDSRYTLVYNEAVLTGSSSVENPIKELNVAQEGGIMEIQAEVTYDGASERFIFNMNAEYIVVPNTENLDYELWKHKCQQKVSNALSKSVVYLGSGRSEYNDNIDISSAIQPDKQKTASTKTQKEEQSIASTKSTVNERKSTAKEETTVSQKTNGVKNPVKQSDYSSVGTCNDYTSQNKDFLVGVKQYKDSCGGDGEKTVVEFITSEYYPDSTIVICLKVENAVTKEKTNMLLPITGQKNHTHDKLIFDEDRNLVDYALCKENPRLADSVSISSDGIQNKTNHVIAVLTDSNFACLIIPEETVSFEDFNHNNMNLRYYNVPNSVLIDKYLPLTFWPYMKEMFVESMESCLIIFLVCIPMGVIIDIEEKGFVTTIKDIFDIKVWCRYVAISFGGAAFIFIIFVCCSVFDYFVSK